MADKPKKPTEPVPNTVPVDNPVTVAPGFGGSVHGGAVPTPEPPFKRDKPQPDADV